jgi:hypothetical protein
MSPQYLKTLVASHVAAGALKVVSDLSAALYRKLQISGEAGQLTKRYALMIISKFGPKKLV